MNELKGELKKQTLEKYELRYFEELDIKVDKEDYKNALELYDMGDLREDVEIYTNNIFIKTDKGFYIGLKVCSEKAKRTSDIYSQLDDNTELIIFTPEQETTQNIIVGKPRNRYSSEDDECVGYEFSKDDISKMKEYNEYIEYARNFKDKVENKLRDYNRKELKNYDDVSVGATKIYRYLSDEERLFNEMLGFINGMKQLTMLKSDLKHLAKQDILEHFKDVKEEILSTKLKADEEVTLATFDVTRKLQIGDRLEFENETLTFPKDNDGKFSVALKTKYNIVKQALVINQDEYKKIMAKRDVDEYSSYYDTDDLNKTKINLNSIYSYNTYDEVIRKLNDNKQDYDITKDDKTLEIRFDNGRFKVNDSPMNKQHFKRIFNNWKQDTSVDIDELIKIYKLLGVRKQLLVDELNKVTIQNVGRSEETITIDVNVRPIDKNIAEFKFLNLKIILEWEKLVSEFVYGNRVSSSNYVGLYKLTKLGFEKKDVLEQLKNFMLLKQF